MLYCIRKLGDADKWYAHLETGFAGGNMLLQGSVLGVGCWFGTELSGDERVEVHEAVDVPIINTAISELI
jgi:hypothetical protein